MADNRLYKKDRLNFNSVDLKKVGGIFLFKANKATQGNNKASKK